MSKAVLRVTFIFLVLAFAGGENAFGQLCGPDAYAPSVRYENRGGRRIRIVPKPQARKNYYDSLANYRFDMAQFPFFGFDMTLRKFDEFGPVGWCDTQARLDNFAIELQNDPTAQGYIVVHGGDGDKKDEEARKRTRASFSKLYLTNNRGIDERRIVTVDGGYRSDFATELFTAPEYDYKYKVTGSVEMPSPDCRLFTAEGYSACAPSNWRRLTRRGITFAPTGAFKGPGVFTHGVEFLTINSGKNLRQGAEQFRLGIAGFSKFSELRTTSIDGKEALETYAFRTDEDTGLSLRTTIHFVMLMQDAQDPAMLCVITTAPVYEYDGYQETFNRILRSIKLAPVNQRSRLHKPSLIDEISLQQISHVRPFAARLTTR